MKKEIYNFGGVPDIVLLRELLRRNVVTNGEKNLSKICLTGCEAPTKITFVEKHYEIIVGIGKDNYAKIFITKDDVDALDFLIEV